MKNIFLVLIILTVILTAFPTAAHAEEIIPVEGVVEEITTQSEETPYDTTQEPPTSQEDAEVVSLLDRIVEAWENGEIANVISLAFDAALLIFVAILKKSGGKNKIEMVAAVKNTKDTTVTAVNDLISAANDVVNAVEGDGGVISIINGFKEDVTSQIEEIKKIDKEKLEGYGKELKSTMAAVKLLSEMLQTVYANSTTISMPTKNMVAEKYVEICDLMKKETTNEQ
jgi:hypothetical protein